MEELILCVPDSELDCFWDGQLMPGLHKVLYAIAEMDGRFLTEEKAESLKYDREVVVYCVIRDNERGVLRYRRHDGDDRLRSLWSLGVGGHVNLNDADQASGVMEDTMQIAAAREINEEFKVENLELEVIGVIKSDANPVCRDHIGVVFFAYADIIAPRTEKDFEFFQPKRYEVWSKIILNEL